MSVVAGGCERFCSLLRCQKLAPLVHIYQFVLSVAHSGDLHRRQVNIIWPASSAYVRVICESRRLSAEGPAGKQAGNEA
jgi:hypothetical protein